MRESHFQRVESEVDIRSVLVAARGVHTLHHLHSVFGHLTGGTVLAAPVRVSEFGNNVAAFLQRVQRVGNVEFAPQRVRVNAIAPSATMTDRVKKLMAGNPAIDKLAQSHLLGLIQPEDIANAALYLASDESRMVTGQILPVDSGVTIS